MNNLQSRVAYVSKFMQHPSAEQKSENAEMTQCGYVRSTGNAGGGGEYLSSTSAFTLAEVLITLGIIGVVATLTLPTLITNYKNKEYATRAKRTYSLINQAVQKYV